MVSLPKERVRPREAAALMLGLRMDVAERAICVKMQAIGFPVTLPQAEVAAKLTTEGEDTGVCPSWEDTFFFTLREDGGIALGSFRNAPPWLAGAHALDDKSFFLYPGSVILVARNVRRPHG
ncbi:MAG TPA: hypothetical protein VF829_03115 [Candidatus Paceibacterota bacterium]